MRPWLGMAAGVALGLMDGLFLELVGADILLESRSITWPVMVVYALTFGALGYAVGRLLEVRDQLRAQQAQLIQSEKLASIGRMAAGVAHEVRNPLGVIRSSAEFISEGLPGPDAELEDACRFIVEEVDRLDVFVADVLDLSRPAPTSERLEPASDVVDRAAVLSGGVVEVDNQTSGELPELFDRVLLGLFVNAAQAGARQVRVTGEPGQLRIEDDGPGIPAELHDQVFEPFFTTKARGTGLGLAMARRVVEAHGGSIVLQSGSVFRIQL